MGGRNSDRTKSYGNPTARETTLAWRCAFFWRSFKQEFFNTYRPELHYMRGPGPAWRAKYGDPVSFRLQAEPD